MSDSSACGMLTAERAISGTIVLMKAYAVLDAIRQHSPHQAELIGQLPEQLAVLEGLLESRVIEGTHAT